jgi:hypothetical protein
MYLPMSLNAPILVGALVAAAVKKGKATDETKKARNDKGIIIASGFIAGAAIIGVILRGLGAWSITEPILDAVDLVSGLIARGSDPEALGRIFNWFGLVAFLLLCVFIFWDSRRAKAEVET